MSERRIAIFLSHAEPGPLRLAASSALAAASLGARVDVFLFGGAVPALIAASEGDSDAGDPAGQLCAARKDGVRLVACSASVVEERVDLQAAERALDAVVGWPSILEWSRDVPERFFF